MVCTISRVQRRPSLIVMCAAALVMLCRAEAAPPPEPPNAQNPPPVESATLEVLANPTSLGNTVIRVKFRDGRFGTQIPVKYGNVQRIMRDDGQPPDNKGFDGIYALQVKADIPKFV